MTPALYFKPLIRPDRAQMLVERKRSCWFNFLYSGRDKRFRELFDGTPLPASDSERFAKAALHWLFYSVTPDDRGLCHMPQHPATTLHTLAGDCDDGALLLASMIVSALHPDAWGRFRFCVGAVNGRGPHAFLEMDSETLGCTLLDWTIDPEPCVAADVVWKTESSFSLAEV